MGVSGNLYLLRLGVLFVIVVKKRNVSEDSLHSLAVPAFVILYRKLLLGTLQNVWTLSCVER